jgi:hypothetical protein
MTVMAQRLALALLIAVAASSCGGGPVDPSKNVTEPRSGTLQPLGISVPTPPFTVSNLGEFTVSMTALSPGNVFVGIGWGQWNGNGCGLIAGQTNVVGTANIGRTVLSGQIFIKGDYCVAVFDASSTFGAPPLTTAQNYTVQVSHP